jgi:hypothetical protein
MKDIAAIPVSAGPMAHALAAASSSPSAASPAAPFPPQTEVVIYSHQATVAKGPKADTTGEALVDMSAWSYGLPYGEALPDGDAIVAYYAGTPTAMDIHWARLRLPKPKR